MNNGINKNRIVWDEPKINKNNIEWDTQSSSTNFTAPAAPDLSQAEHYQKPSFMDNAKNFVDRGVNEVNDFAKIGLGINETPFAPKEDNNQPDFGTLADVKSLSKTDDPTTWRTNVTRLLQSKGYSDVRFGKNDDIVATSHEGKAQNISGGFIKNTLASMVGDKYKETGAIAGATKGFKYASKLPIPNPLLKSGAIALGTAFSAGLGGLTGEGADQVEANIRHDEQLTSEERITSAGNSANDSMLAELGGYAVGKTMTAAPDAYNLLKKAVGEKLASKIYGEVAQFQDPKQISSVLELADDFDVKLTPSQLTDNKSVNQLTSVVAQNPVLSEIMNKINKNNKVSMNSKIRDLLDKVGVDSTALMGPNNIDPLGKEIQDSLLNSKDIRKRQVQNAYDLFESSVTGKGKTDLRKIGQKIIDLKEDSLTMPNPESYNKILNLAGNRIAEMYKKKGYLDAKDLNNLNKQINQIYKRNFDDSSARSAVMMLKPTIDKQLELLAKVEGDDVYSALKKAKDLHIEKEGIYGKTSQLPFSKTIDNKAIETIVDNLMNSKQGVTNVKVLKQELSMLPNGKNVMGSLARRFIDESLSKANKANSIYSVKEIDSKGLLDAFKNVDYRQLEILTDKETVDGLHNIRKLTELIAKQDKMLSGQGGGHNTMGMIRSNIIDKVMDFVRIKAFGKIITTPSTQRILQQTLKDIAENNTTAAKQSIKQLNQKIKGE